MNIQGKANEYKGKMQDKSKMCIYYNANNQPGSHRYKAWMCFTAKL